MTRQQAKADYTTTERKKIWLDLKSSIIKSDAVIVEASQNTFSIGYQTALALSNKKLALVLSKNSSLNSNIVMGEDNPLLMIARYDDVTLESVLDGFFNKYVINKNELRFNLLLDRETQMYLDYRSYQTGKSKARLIRDMINNEMRNNTGGLN